MPELPEVETVRRGLLPLAGTTVERVAIHRPDLRFPFPERLAERLTGARIEAVERRGKYLVLPLSSGESLIAHLGMTGRFTLDARQIGDFFHDIGKAGHEHFRLEARGPDGTASLLTYADPRRFGYMDLVDSREIAACRHFAGMGPEPLEDSFTPERLRAALSGRRTPLKAALLDQGIVAGLGNIYVCEALYKARLSPRRGASTVGPGRAVRLHGAIVRTLLAAIAAGGSTLRDYAAADGAMGYFQHDFDVYGREGEGCRSCGGVVRRIVQSGRSTFFCPDCQR